MENNYRCRTSNLILSFLPTLSFNSAVWVMKALRTAYAMCIHKIAKIYRVTTLIPSATDLSRTKAMLANAGAKRRLMLISYIFRLIDCIYLFESN
ncbi:hypothetical protein BCF53_1142 [Reinekea marinisedimentorum]|uniref:Uncharacterized protein n=1 Tax=Reinekea marinisedimentorum TaxID=230495 RepID=A0A4R3HZK2_9GAMM|nr:hypothetical protein BCF53_1142 [Reinekea marinisedimentorum]